MSGLISKRLRAEVLERDNYRCAYCGCCLRVTRTPCPYEDGVYLVHGNSPTIDHKVPRLRGGSHKADNLTASCEPCNSQKGMRTPEEYQAWKDARS